MRTFIALEVPDAFADDVVGVARQLGRAVEGRFLPRGTYHVTLAFLGEVDAAGVQRAADALDAACAGRAPVPLRADGLGKFGRAGDATLWLGLAKDPGLMELAAAVRGELDARGVGYDRKAFLPHLTLARRARIPSGTLPALAFPADDTGRAVTLFKSTLEASGAVYKSLHTAELG